MVQKHRLACRLTGYLLAVALVAVSCLVPGIAASAAAPTYTAYKAGFEESVYDGSARLSAAENRPRSSRALTPGTRTTETTIL